MELTAAGVVLKKLGELHIQAEVVVTGGGGVRLGVIMLIAMVFRADLRCSHHRYTFSLPLFSHDVI